MKNKERVVKKLRKRLKVADNIADDELLDAVKNTVHVGRAEFSVAMDDLKTKLCAEARDMCAEVSRRAVEEFIEGRTNDKS